MKQTRQQIFRGKIGEELRIFLKKFVEVLKTDPLCHFILVPSSGWLDLNPGSHEQYLSLYHSTTKLRQALGK